MLPAHLRVLETARPPRASSLAARVDGSAHVARAAPLVVDRSSDRGLLARPCVPRPPLFAALVPSRTPHAVALVPGSVAARLAAPPRPAALTPHSATTAHEPGAEAVLCASLASVRVQERPPRPAGASAAILAVDRARPPAAALLAVHAQRSSGGGGSLLPPQRTCSGSGVSFASSTLSFELALIAGERPRVRKRRRASAAELAALVSHADVQEYRLDRAAEWLADELPPASILHLLGGERGLQQVPDPAERRAALVGALKLKGGADGSSLGKARRALETLRAYAVETDQPDEKELPPPFGVQLGGLRAHTNGVHGKHARACIYGVLCARRRVCACCTVARRPSRR
jgi:hypothetical protein